MAEYKKYAHDVYFTLSDKSQPALEKLLADCDTYIKDKHEGMIFCAAGIRDETMVREVNDTEFDVCLHMVFESKEAHDVYQVSTLHKEFISRNKPNWAKIRVFDAKVS